MNPAILLVCHPQAHLAQSRVTGMFESLGVSHLAAGMGIELASGEDWAAAAIPPNGNEPTCGAAIHSDGQDVLIWAGEMFLPESWQGNCGSSFSRDPQGSAPAISAAVLRQLQNNGIETMEYVDGAYCAAWFNARRHEWTIFNDKMGMIPLFWAAQDDGLVISPHAWLTWQGLSGLQDSRPSLYISDYGVTDLIRTQNMTDDHTLIDGVFWLKRGHAVTWGEEGAGYRRYWDFKYSAEPIRDEGQAVESYLDALQRTMRRYIRCDAPLMLGISGGIDSRLFLAMCEKIGRVPSCFSAGWPFYDDVRFGRQLARLAGADHDWVPLDSESLPSQLRNAIVATDGLQSAGNLAPAAAIRNYLQQHTGAVLLEGFFHGLVGGSTVPADADMSGDQPLHATRWAHTHLHSGGEVSFVNGLLRPDLAAESYQSWQSSIDDAYRRAPMADPLQPAEYMMARTRRGRIDVLGTGLSRRDVLMRNPACDRAMIAWHQNTAPRLRRGRQIYLSALRRYFPRYARVPRADGCGALPIATDRWLRDYHWQREKLHRLYVRYRHPWTRTCGTDGRAIRAWSFDVWRQSGELDVLIDPQARVLNWVRRKPLAALWDQAVRDPMQAEPLLTLATLEIMIRWLEGSSNNRTARADHARFRSIQQHNRKRPDNSTCDCVALLSSSATAQTTA